MNCPNCRIKTETTHTIKLAIGVRRYHECVRCGLRFGTMERITRITSIRTRTTIQTIECVENPETKALSFTVTPKK